MKWFWLSVVLTLFTLAEVLSRSADEVEDFISIPIMFQDPEGELTLVLDTSNISADFDAQIKSFCDTHSIQSSCDILNDLVRLKLREISPNLLRPDLSFSIPLMVDDKGQRTRHDFHFDPSDEAAGSVEVGVFSFCDAHNIGRLHCDLLLKAAQDKVKEAVWADVSRVPPPNPHLQRNTEAVSAERINSLREELKSDGGGDEVFDWEVEAEVDQAILREFLSRTKLSNRVCFIHSCSLGERSYEVLLEMLTSIRDSGLLADLGALFVLNYGYNNRDLRQLAELFPTVVWIHRSDDISRFEIPTLRHLHHFSKSAIAVSEGGGGGGGGGGGDGGGGGEVQVLYLHTKGVSYKQDYPQIRDWRRMMMHFLVSKHTSCNHLLLSGEFDTVGSNFDSFPRAYSGNMWWATASYLAALPELQPSDWKYKAETWLLSHSTARVYIAHHSNVNHAVEEYPPQRYDDEHRYRQIFHCMAVYSINQTA